MPYTMSFQIFKFNVAKLCILRVQISIATVLLLLYTKDSNWFLIFAVTNVFILSDFIFEYFDNLTLISQDQVDH